MIGLVAVLVLVLANGFFVASEFALVSMRRSRVAELVTLGRRNASALKSATDALDLHLAATQFGITLASLALGMIGEPALAHLIEPAFAWLPPLAAGFGAHGLAVALAFTAITALHIVLGELAPKSLALQRSEQTALAVVLPLRLFVIVFRPATHVLNLLGNATLRLVRLQPTSEEGSLHSASELRMLVAASRDAGLIQAAQDEVVSRIFSLNERKVREIMTPRHDIDWVDLNDAPADQHASVLDSAHEQIVVGRGNLDQVVGVLSKQDLLTQMMTSGRLDLAAAMRPVHAVHECTPILKVFDTFKALPVRMAVIVDEYGMIQGLVTQADLIEAITGDFADHDGAQGDIELQPDGSLMLDGMMPAYDAFERLGIPRSERGDGHPTLAGFLIGRVGDMPDVGTRITVAGWSLKVMTMTGRRITRIRAQSATRATA